MAIQSKWVYLISALLIFFIGTSSAYFGITTLLIIPIVVVTALFVAFLYDRLKLYHYVAIMIVAIIFSPSIAMPVGPEIRLDDLWLLFGFIVLALKYSLGKVKISIPFKKLSLVFVIFIFWIAVTILISSFQEPYYYTHRDWLEVYKNFKFLVVFWIAASLKINSLQIQKLGSLIIWSLTFASLFGIAQYFNIANVNSWLTPYFLADSQVEGFVRNERVVGTFANPNVFAGFTVIGIALSFSKLLNRAKTSQAIHLLIYLSALFLTQSRTGLICAVVAILTIFLLSFAKNKKKGRLLGFTALSSVVPLIALNYAPEQFFNRMDNLRNISTDGSLMTRVNRWERVYETRVEGSIITGNGPVSKIVIYFDNEWLQILTDYGLIGIFLVVSFFTLMYFVLRKTGRMNRDVMNLSIAGQAMIATFAVYMITLAVFQQLQMMPLIMICFGLAISTLNNQQPVYREKQKIA